MTRTIAVMQPYLYPYGGYFRLLAASDVFVVFDDVQHVRRGRVHRCEVADGRWLTLPLRPQPRETPINALEFAPDARATFDARLAEAGIPPRHADPAANIVCEQLYGAMGAVTDFLVDGLRAVAGGLDLPVQILRSSALGTPAGLRGEARIIDIVRSLGGTRYLNAPGGRALYDAQAFRAAGLELRFLPHYDGAYRFLLPTILRQGLFALRAEMRGIAPEA